ncbi:hypothetical protein BLNAU_11950 [Blattamonas nauphoetae]|uniref:RRM domain-containing protein n=1 Tax=Blattamonas nauphoetae TaxID=2049346 RepID=A0ABQ9XN34_9EUKA|nr:hypothetical protein BLNAU_11950 [Blattamonas nauphoetae]
MSTKKQIKTPINVFGDSSGNWGDDEGDQQEEYQPQPRHQEDDYDRGDRRYDDRDQRGGGGYYRGGRDNYGSRGNQDLRRRDQMIRSQREDGGHRFSNADGPPRYERTRHENVSWGRAEEEDALPTEGPFIVIATRLPSNYDMLQTGQFFEDQGCAIVDIDPYDGHEPGFKLTFEDQESLKRALEQSRKVIEGCSISVDLEQKEKPKPQPREPREDRGGYGERRGGYGDRRGGYGGGRGGGYGDRRGGGYGDRRGGGYGDRSGGYGERRGGYGERSGGYGGRRYGDDDRDGEDRGGYGERRGGYGDRRGGYGERRGGYGERSGGYGERRGGYGERREPNAPPREEGPPGEKVKMDLTVKIEKKAKVNPFGEAQPKDIHTNVGSDILTKTGA